MDPAVFFQKESDVCFVPGDTYQGACLPSTELVRSYESIGFIGLGKVGASMAHNLAEDGFPLTVWNRTSGKDAQFTNLAHVTVASDIVQAFKNKEIVVLCLSDGKASEEVMTLALQELTEEEKPQLIINLATIDPEEGRRLGDISAVHGVRYLDVAFVGGMPSVEKRSSFFIAAGDTEAFAHGALFLQRLGSEIIYVGERIGDAQRYKAVNQFVSAQHHLALAETFALAESWGVSTSDLRNELFENSNSSQVMNWAVKNKFEAVAAHDFEGHHSIRNFAKDLEISHRQIERVAGDRIFHTQQNPLGVVLRCFDTAIEKGLGETGHHLLYQLLLDDGYQLDVPEEERNSKFLAQRIQHSNVAAYLTGHALSNLMDLHNDAMERRLASGTGASQFLNDEIARKQKDSGRASLTLPTSMPKSE